MTPPPGSGTPHLRYIDCVRGYAVLLVISCHLVYLFPEMPYPVKRLVSSGWFGVQMFFLASCLTLIFSWRAEQARRGGHDVIGFFIRRFFRIAPAYYAAGLLYYLIDPPPGGFDAAQALYTAVFVNAWHPDWMPSAAGPWSVVPGGWSIGVEFTFYALFPFYAAWAHTLRRALIALAAALAVGVAANLAAAPYLYSHFRFEAADNFLHFWFPNQLSVFALGGVLASIVHIGPPTRRRAAALVAALACAAFAVLAFLPGGHYLGASPLMPAALSASLAFGVFILAMAHEPAFFSNRYVAAMGKVSFSAYLLHFAVLEGVGSFPDTFRIRAAGTEAILTYAAVWIAVVAAVFLASRVTFTLIEQPMMALGSRLNRARHSRA